MTMRAGRSGSTCRKMNDVVTIASAISQAGNSSTSNVNR